MKRTPLKRISDRRMVETTYYAVRRRRFLREHPYCQEWLREHGVEESEAIRNGGNACIEGRTVAVPLATEVHHMNKRRGVDLLDERYWLAVSAEAHARIEAKLGWARECGLMQPF